MPHCSLFRSASKSPAWRRFPVIPLCTSPPVAAFFSLPPPHAPPPLPLVASFSNTSVSSTISAATAPSMAKPPTAKKVKHEMEMFRDVRVDDYYWLRDDSRSDPDVLSYLKEENAYTNLVLSGSLSDVKQFQNQLYTEIRGRIKEDDITVPIRRGGYYYYKRTLKGKEYVQHCRRCIRDGGATSVFDVMSTGPEASEEHLILDENIKAEGCDYYSIGAFKVSPNNKLVAYAEDTKEAKLGLESLGTGQEDAEAGTLEEYATVVPFKVAMKGAVRSGDCAGRGRGPGSRQ
ncbi:hypothetical protein C4D60_Mb04t15700 [Musa balbisiana]|uniref:Peptidase S9A N-terminal domain-containing protein n=1 Tax=Musa balbisiana TaxID=52838 RepID=A0A4S8KCB8_MUSBA|nr:hypothetical protein C4D60_Mb04t15700 [Musa balbisiana]